MKLRGMTEIIVEIYEPLYNIECHENRDQIENAAERNKKIF